MWAYGETPPPIEKIRKPQWTAENTARTQAVVNHLAIGMEALQMVFGKACPAVGNMRVALKRFKELDPGVKLPPSFDDDY